MPAPSKHYGLAAVGKTDRFNIEIDEALHDSDDLQMSIGALSWSFRFALAERGQVRAMLTFLREQTGRLVFSEITLGLFHGAPVLLVKDDEFGDRFWLRARGEGQLVEFVLVGADLAEFTDAVAQVVQGLGRLSVREDDFWLSRKDAKTQRVVAAGLIMEGGNRTMAARLAAYGTIGEQIFAGVQGCVRDFPGLDGDPSASGESRRGEDSG